MLSRLSPCPVCGDYRAPSTSVPCEACLDAEAALAAHFRRHREGVRPMPLSRTYSIARFEVFPEKRVTGPTFATDVIVSPDVTRIERIVLNRFDDGLVSLTLGNMIVLDRVPLWALPDHGNPLLDVPGAGVMSRVTLRLDEMGPNWDGRLFTGGLWVRSTVPAF